MKFDVIEAFAPEHLRIKIKFRDGMSGEVKFAESHLHGVFESLKDPDVFKQVSCSNGFVEWPGDIDLAPDAMYEEIKKQVYGSWSEGS